ncbi:DUF3618 domain-containing protein [Phycicoccus endophyticus]|uniref:DUF3618 domain-containing protein n=1 Tax=Phycicoccus endophyticus TaxID=1690220 RepID=A0A7G9QZZ7_9MICO|nr:DUF3618 domain-containing protein [Phycicoccus endophyticus]NHI20781.1 DUF3618 domain-containing protein [Phycicoccus endophyticus]QNN48922.1 DUF3618 domain-containing protein [Phycicoccus endophyticus]GGL43871.1 hypothetical protein GCM10012283_28080 [Phycicoccus endophyticus]
MSTTPPEPTPRPEESTDPERIEEHIAATREDLAATIDALEAKVDVVGRASDRARALRAAATDEVGRPRTAVLAAAAVVVVGLVAAAVVLGRRR